MADGLLGAVRGLWLAHPELGLKPLLAKLREQQPDLGAGAREVREVLLALMAESEATEAAAAAPPAAGEGSAPSNASLALSLACFGCGRLPSEMGDGRVKHDVCPICVKLKVPTTYWCCVNCPGNPAAWKRHAVVHKEVKQLRKRSEDGGVVFGVVQCELCLGLVPYPMPITHRKWLQNWVFIRKEDTTRGTRLSQYMAAARGVIHLSPSGSVPRIKTGIKTEG